MVAWEHHFDGASWARINSKFSRRPALSASLTFDTIRPPVCLRPILPSNTLLCHILSRLATTSDVLSLSLFFFVLSRPKNP